MAIYTNTTVSQRREQFLSSWREFAPDVTFAGFTLAQFEEESMKPLDIRNDMADAKTKLSGLMLKREKADETLNEEMIRVANAIRADRLFGVDCEFYRSLGYVPKSERKKNTVRKKKVSDTSGTTAPPDTNAV